MQGTEEDAHRFVTRWRGAGGSERANYQLFVDDLCALLGVPLPQPAQGDERDNAYVFERRVAFAHGDGSTSAGFIDCYRRGAFVLEAKKISAGARTPGFDDALLRARAQAEGYARALPAAERRPPFVVDVGNVIELYAEFMRSGATCTPFPDARSHHIRFADLADAALRERLRLMWPDPMTLDPSRAAAKVTRAAALQLAALARSLEAAGHPAETVAAFLTRCLFSMLAEDVGLLPKAADGSGGFVGQLRRHRDDPATLRKMIAVLWADMDRGGFSAALAQELLRFNGKLFKGWQTQDRTDYVLAMNRDQIDGLLAAAAANWREVEPAIFGTLLQRALDPAERHALGAHYTPRAFVERLVLPTVAEPLRADWADAQAAALLLANEANALDGKNGGAPTRLAGSYSPTRRSTVSITAAETRKSDACSRANTSRADAIRPRLRAMPITAAVPATRKPCSTATARPARSSIRSSAGRPCSRTQAKAMRMQAALPQRNQAHARQPAPARLDFAVASVRRAGAGAGGYR